MNLEKLRLTIMEYEQIKDWFKKRTDFKYNWNDPYLFWWKGSNSKFYRIAVYGAEPVTYRISVYIRTECVEVEARIYDQSDVNNTKVLDKIGKNFKFKIVSDRNLASIISYIQKLDNKCNKFVKDYFFQNKLKKMQTDF